MWGAWFNIYDVIIYQSMTSRTFRGLNEILPMLFRVTFDFFQLSVLNPHFSRFFLFLAFSLYTLTHTHTHTHTNTQEHTPTCTLSHSQVHGIILFDFLCVFVSHISARLLLSLRFFHSDTHTHAHTHTHTRKYTHTRAHTHMHAHIYSSFTSQWVCAFTPFSCFLFFPNLLFFISLFLFSLHGHFLSLYVNFALFHTFFHLSIFIRTVMHSFSLCCCDPISVSVPTHKCTFFSQSEFFLYY